jgi:hypothetical protein
MWESSKRKIGGKVKLITVGKMVVRTVSGLQRHRTKDSWLYHRQTGWILTSSRNLVNIATTDLRLKNYLIFRIKNVTM